ncbi:hypothetical protein [Streptomyces chrestomyceticus]|uniref:hypothetical protein n=1 Tax=Streptomyces chrestomyceticus TaxID=68185 RepID=UPI0035A9293D
MPTYEATPRFITDLERLTAEQRTCFRRAVTAFVHDLRTGGHFRAGLREAREFAESWAPWSTNPHARLAFTLIRR